MLHDTNGTVAVRAKDALIVLQARHQTLTALPTLVLPATLVFIFVIIQPMTKAAHAQFIGHVQTVDLAHNRIKWLRIFVTYFYVFFMWLVDLFS